MSSEEHRQQLNLRIDSGFIEKFAIEKMQLGKPQQALRFLEQALGLPGIDPDKKLLIYLRLLNGTAHTFSDGHLELDNESVIDSSHPIFGKAEEFADDRNDLRERLDSMTQQNIELHNKMQFLINHMSHSQLDEIGNIYASQGDSDLYDGFMLPYSDETISEDVHPMLRSFLKEQHRLDQSHRQGQSEIQYGWLSPDAEFYPVEYGSHYKWAEDYVNEHGWRDDYMQSDTNNCEDYMQTVRHWVLLHNPAMGLPEYYIDITQKLTKAQRDWLYDFYISAGETEKANKVMLD